mmetsp:Transcript_7983/g.11860  ORF Transcript_7983/g.11860 Transcript_7983/m.11860 type:complete len:259 (+) Transcript_7983:832-1608(+)
MENILHFLILNVETGPFIQYQETKSLLEDKKLDFLKENAFGQTILDAIIILDRPALFELLINNHELDDLISEHVVSMERLLMKFGRLEMIKSYLKRYNDVSRGALLALAVEMESEPIIDYLLSLEETNINEKLIKTNKTFMHYLVEREKCSYLKHIIKTYDVDFFNLNYRYKTPFDIIFEHKIYRVLELLIDLSMSNDLDVNLKAFEKRTMLYCCLASKETYPYGITLLYHKHLNVHETHDSQSLLHQLLKNIKLKKS